MKRIFYIHSNIVSICCYHTVKESIEKGDKVIIVTNRGCKWPFFKENVIVYDFKQIFAGEDKNRHALYSIQGIKDYIRYRKYMIHLKRVVNKIIDKENFIFYLPSMALDAPYVFSNNSFCKGYYYVDEGTLSYRSEESLKNYLPQKKKNIIKRIIGIEDHYHYETTSKFLGTISITDTAFKWNNSKEKIVNPIDGYIEEIKTTIPFFDDVIITNYLSEDFQKIKDCFDVTISYILRRNPHSIIGLKIHPQAITYNKENTTQLRNYVKEHYSRNISEIDINISVEIMSILFHPNLFSLFEKSSILLYALLLNTSKTYVSICESNSFYVTEISSVENYHLLEYNS